MKYCKTVWFIQSNLAWLQHSSHPVWQLYCFADYATKIFVVTFVSLNHLCQFWQRLEKCDLKKQTKRLCHEIENGGVTSCHSILWCLHTPPTLAHWLNWVLANNFHIKKMMSFEVHTLLGQKYSATSTLHPQEQLGHGNPHEALSVKFFVCFLACVDVRGALKLYSHWVNRALVTPPPQNRSWLVLLEVFSC